MVLLRLSWLMYQVRGRRRWKWEEQRSRADTPPLAFMCCCPLTRSQVLIVLVGRLGLGAQRWEAQPEQEGGQCAGPLPA